MAVCIWCKGVDVPSALEHIIPEALGCPSGFVLSDGTVCRECNNGLAHLDQAVIEDFDIFAYMSGVPRKKGRPCEIRSRGNLIGTQGPNGNEISINMERYPVTAHDGTNLGGFGNSDRNIQASFDRQGDSVKISFSTTIVSKPKFARGIVKIALSSLAYFLGGELTLSEDFDSVREFVREGKGIRPVLLKQSSTGGYLNQSWPPFKSETDGYAVTFRLVGIEFCVDLTLHVTLFPMLKDKALEAFGETGWSYLPIDT